MTLTSADHLRQTEAFVEENATDLVLTTYAKTPDGQGGWTKDTPTARNPQRLRFVGSSRLRDVTVVTTPDGKRVIPSALLIGLPDCVIEIGDTFTYEGEDYLVLSVNRTPPWRVQADVGQEEN